MIRPERTVINDGKARFCDWLVRSRVREGRRRQDPVPPLTQLLLVLLVVLAAVNG
jgi:hypothetical protein